MNHTGERPLVNLLGYAKDAFLADFDRRLSTSEFATLSLAHAANVLRHLDDGPQQASHIVAVCGVTKQAVSQQISQLARNGYVTVTRHPTDLRARVLHATEKGRRARKFVERTFAEIEAEWVAALGPDDGPHLRRILTELATRVER